MSPIFTLGADAAGDTDDHHVVERAEVEETFGGGRGEHGPDTRRGRDHVGVPDGCRCVPPPRRSVPGRNPNAFTTGRSSDFIGASTPTRTRSPSAMRSSLPEMGAPRPTKPVDAEIPSLTGCTAPSATSRSSSLALVGGSRGGARRVRIAVACASSAG